MDGWRFLLSIVDRNAVHFRGCGTCIFATIRPGISLPETEAREEEQGSLSSLESNHKYSPCSGCLRCTIRLWLDGPCSSAAFWQKLSCFGRTSHAGRERSGKPGLRAVREYGFSFPPGCACCFSRER